MTALKIIGIIAVVICAVLSFTAKKFLAAVYKHEADDAKITKFKLAMFMCVLVGAFLIIVPDYL